ncbi:hypothetical protein B0H13DRAFT_2349598 [Mycena leptocephala]|nr:hypothetical protein B0H13DRAFT_2349598 [Mycena leptocephala]
MSLEVHQDMSILRPLYPLSCAGALVLWCPVSTTTTRTASHACTYPPPPMSFVLDLASFISLRLVQAEARSAGHSQAVYATSARASDGCCEARGWREEPWADTAVGVCPASNLAVLATSYFRGCRTWASVFSARRGAQSGRSHARTAQYGALLRLSLTCRAGQRAGVRSTNTLSSPSEEACPLVCSEGCLPSCFQIFKTWVCIYALPMLCEARGKVSLPGRMMCMMLPGAARALI